MKKLFLTTTIALFGTFFAAGQTQPKQKTETKNDTVKEQKNKKTTQSDSSKRVIIGRDGKPARTYKKK